MTTNNDAAALAGVECARLGIEFIGPEVTDATPLASLQATGILLLYSPELASLAGFEQLRSIHGQLAIGGSMPDAGCSSTQFSSLEPLSSLEELGELFICNNAELSSLQPLAGALDGHVPGAVDIYGLPALQSLAGFEALASVGQGVALSALPQVADLQPLASLTDVGGALTISELDGITSLEGLESVTEVNSLLIVGNVQLTTIAGLEGLLTVEDNLSVHDNPMLPQAEVEAWAAGIDVGTTITICNNLDGPPC